MDDINKMPEVVKKVGKCSNNYDSCHIYSGFIDELDHNVHMYISGNCDRGHLSTTIEHVKVIHKTFGEFIKEYDKEQERIDKERVVLLNCLDCEKHRLIKDPEPNNWFSDKEAVLCTLTPNDNILNESKWASDLSAFKSVVKCCNPKYTRQRSNVPSWCPIGYYKFIVENKEVESNG